MLAKTQLERRRAGGGAVALLLAIGLVGGPWAAEARAQAPAVTPGSPWAGYAPGSAWARYGPAAAARSQPAQHQVYTAPPSGATGWAGYAPGRAWMGYAPARAWTNYAPPRAWRASPVYGNVPAPSRYREYGTGRPVPLSKPWLPGSP